MKQAKVLTETERKRVLTTIAKGSYPQRNRAMLMLSWLAGMRVAEIAGLTVGDVRNEDGSTKERVLLRANQTKGSDSRTVLLNSQLQAELAAYLSSLKAPHVPQQPLFQTRRGKPFSANSLCQRFIAIYQAAGVSGATSHSGRRTFITTLAHKGVNVRVLAALAGHRSISTTQRYIDLNENVMKEAVNLL